MSTEFIIREAALKHQYYGILEDDYYVLVRDIMEIPSVDVRPVVRGEWHYHPLATWKFECSECGNYFPEDWNFCACCGADMRGKCND